MTHLLSHLASVALAASPPAEAAARAAAPVLGKVVEAPWVHRLDDFGVCQACREIREREVDVYGMRIRHTGQ